MTQLAGDARRALQVDPLPANPFRALVSPYTWLATVHLFSDVWVGMVTFIAIVVLLALSASLMLLALLGVPIFIATVYLVIGFSAFERGRFRLTLGMEIPAPPLPQRTSSVLRYMWRLVTAASTWRQIAYHVLHLPLGVFTTVATALAWSAPLTLALLPLYNHQLAAGGANLWFFHVRSLPDEFLASAVGVLLLMVTPFVIRGLSMMDAAIGRVLLGGFSSGELVARVGELEESRRQVVDSAEAERRRIERDLHDGAQQRLVALAMTLGRAKSKDDDPEAVRGLIDEAHQEAKRAIVELRNLTRGIHPPVLTDRGLDAALSALAARSPVPVTVEVDLGARPTATMEAIAYFVVAEALTNVTKHAHANSASVVVRRLNGTLRIVVTDDGVGGAALEKGTGLQGLANRVSGVDGRLTVDSPAGGPTVLTVELPCK